MRLLRKPSCKWMIVFVIPRLPAKLPNIIYHTFVIAAPSWSYWIKQLIIKYRQIMLPAQSIYYRAIHPSLSLPPFWKNDPILRFCLSRSYRWTFHRLRSKWFPSRVFHRVGTPPHKMSIFLQYRQGWGNRWDYFYRINLAHRYRSYLHR